MSTQRSMRAGWWTGLTLICVVLGTGSYVLRRGSTKGWPETDCSIAGSRVIRDVAPSPPVNSHVVVLYRVEYQLRYTVEGKDFYTWVSSGPSDPDKEFVEAKMDKLPDRCNFRIRYNPNRPSEAVVVSKIQP